MFSQRFRRSFGDVPTTVPAHLLEPMTAEEIERSQAIADKLLNYVLGYSDEVPSGLDNP
jgi:hypothetical protein